MVVKRRAEGPRIALVGPCASGKSTLATRLRALGIEARTPAQEHSGVPTMWRTLLEPLVLVALDAPNDELRARRPGGGLTDTLLGRQRERLAHAARHADLVIDTHDLDFEAALEAILALLEERGVWAPPGD